jgi:alkylated DNA repair protein (DNA oxidative demethylase)
VNPAKPAVQPSLFDAPDLAALPAEQPLAPGALLLRGAALAQAADLLAAVALVTAQSPLRHLVTPGGRRMSVAMSNCGRLGWVSDARGYRYDPLDPLTGRPWPTMPACFSALAAEAAQRAGFPRFQPDACLINRYEPGARLTLHQDRDERPLGQPIVSVSLGLPATFLLGGLLRAERPQKVPLQHGDVVVWGGPSRLAYHGVTAVKDGHHPLTGALRLNLTFRRAA